MAPTLISDTDLLVWEPFSYGFYNNGKTLIPTQFLEITQHLQAALRVVCAANRDNGRSDDISGTIQTGARQPTAPEMGRREE